MHSLVLVMAFLFYALASPVLRSRVVQDVDAFGNLVTAQGNPVDLEGNLFDNVASLASANLESVGTTSDLQPYPARTDHQAANLRLMPTNFGDNINLGAPAQQDQDQPDGPIAFVDKIKQGWNPTADNPCPNLHTLCARSIQYFPLNGIKDADPWDAAEDRSFQACSRNFVFCCGDYNARKRRAFNPCYSAYD